MRSLLVKDLMWKNPSTMLSPEATLREAAEHMTALDCGALPVGAGAELLGIITDRDIVTRALSKGKDARLERVKDHMTPGVFVCKEFDTLEEAAEIMNRHKVSRLAVVTEENLLAGIISFGFLLRNEATPKEVADVATQAFLRQEAAAVQP